jgi:hypothetical protein
MSGNESFKVDDFIQFEQLYAELDNLGSIGIALKPYFREELDSLKTMYEAIEREDRANNKLRAEINKFKSGIGK